MNKKHTRNLFAFALIFFVPLSAMEIDSQESTEDLEDQLIDTAWEENEKRLSELLDRGANVDTQDSNEDINAQDNYGYTPLTKAASNHDLAEVTRLIEKRAKINLKDAHGYTPLYAAIGKLAIVQDLLDAGADPDITYKDDLTPLMKAVWNGLELQVRTLIARGANVDIKNKNGQTASDMAPPNIQKIIEGSQQPTAPPKLELDQKLDEIFRELVGPWRPWGM